MYDEGKKDWYVLKKNYNFYNQLIVFSFIYVEIKLINKFNINTWIDLYI